MMSEYTGWPDARVPAMIRAAADMLAAGEPEDAVGRWMDRMMAEIRGPVPVVEESPVPPGALPKRLGRVYDDRFPYLSLDQFGSLADDMG